MGKAEWSVTVSDELNDAVMAYLAKSGQGVEGLSNLVENAVGKFVKDPRALDKESDVTEGEISDMINAAVQRTKAKFVKSLPTPFRRLKKSIPVSQPASSMT